MIEQLYTDFNAKVLPMIQEGLQITQEYFVELFGRYVTYLITVDIITIVVNMVLFGLLIFSYKTLWNKTSDLDSPDIYGARILGALIVMMPLVITFNNVWSSSIDLVKTIYIPEVRVYEELQQYRNK